MNLREMNVKVEIRVYINRPVAHYNRGDLVGTITWLPARAAWAWKSCQGKGAGKFKEFDDAWVSFAAESHEFRLYVNELVFAPIEED